MKIVALGSARRSVDAARRPAEAVWRPTWIVATLIETAGLAGFAFWRLSSRPGGHAPSLALLASLAVPVLLAATYAVLQAGPSHERR